MGRESLYKSHRKFLSSKFSLFVIKGSNLFYIIANKSLIREYFFRCHKNLYAGRIGSKRCYLAGPPCLH